MKLFRVTKTIEVFIEAENSEDAIDAFCTYALDDPEVDTEEVTDAIEFEEFCVENANEITVDEWFKKNRL